MPLRAHCPLLAQPGLYASMPCAPSLPAPLGSRSSQPLSDRELVVAGASVPLSSQVVELKTGGKDIPVNSANRIAYIHLVADYRLNRQIRQHCLAFRQGLANVVNLEWLRMFDQQEIQVRRGQGAWGAFPARGCPAATPTLGLVLPGADFWRASPHQSGGPEILHQLLWYAAASATAAGRQAPKLSEVVGGLAPLRGRGKEASQVPSTPFCLSPPLPSPWLLSSPGTPHSVMNEHPGLTRVHVPCGSTGRPT